MGGALACYAYLDFTLCIDLVYRKRNDTRHLQQTRNNTSEYSYNQHYRYWNV